MFLYTFFGNYIHRRKHRRRHMQCKRTTNGKERNSVQSGFFFFFFLFLFLSFKPALDMTFRSNQHRQFMRAAHRWRKRYSVTKLDKDDKKKKYLKICSQHVRSVTIVDDVAGHLRAFGIDDARNHWRASNCTNFILKIDELCQFPRRDENNNVLPGHASER
jgi:hypothetical protein